MFTLPSYYIDVIDISDVKYVCIKITSWILLVWKCFHLKTQPLSGNMIYKHLSKWKVFWEDFTEERERHALCCSMQFSPQVLEFLK